MESSAPGSEVLLRASQQGDASALGSLLVRHLPTLRAFVRLRMDPELRAHEAESDFVQSICVDVLRNAERFDFRGETAFRAWLYGAVLNQVRDRRDYWLAACRSVRRERTMDGSSPGSVDRLVTAYSAAFDPGRVAIGREELTRVEAAIAALPEREREVLSLHRFVGLSHAEIGERLGKSAAATRQILHGALTRLALELTEHEFDDQ